MNGTTAKVMRTQERTLLIESERMQPPDGLEHRRASVEAVLLIPAFQPNETLYEVVTTVMNRVKSNVKCIIVNDGSDQSSRGVFDRLGLVKGVELIHHDKNYGKGAALKSGLRRILETYVKARCVVTADADGQHLPNEINEFLELRPKPDELVMGVRKFSKDVPLRSKLGNIVTRFLFKLTFFKNISDTQTGLRAFSTEKMSWMLDVKANKYEFEFDCLIRYARRGSVSELPITTVYEPGNPSSHFNPLKDSTKIFITLFRHSLNVGVVGLFDYLLFAMLFWAEFGIFASLLFARMASSALYFYTARRFVFQSKHNQMLQLIGFGALAFLNVILMWPFIQFLSQEFSITPYFSMALGYLMLFVTNFLLQYHVIFRR